MSTNDQQQPQTQVISLQTISQNFLGALQRQFDLLAYNLAAAQQVDAEHYESFARQSKIMPVQQLHQNFGQIQAYSRGLILRQTINDLLNMTTACMDNCHLLCALVKNQGTDKTATEETQKAVAEAQGSFVRAPLNDKFERLEKEFGIMCEMEDAIIAVAIGLRVLMTRNATVATEDLDDDGELVFEFKTVQTINPPKGSEKLQPEIRIVDTRRAFKAGDILDLSNSEMLGLSITIASFFHNLFRSVDEFGRKTLGERAATPPPPSGESKPPPNP